MSASRVNPRFSLVRTLLLSVSSLGALALPLSSAKAQCVGVDLGFGCAGLGVGSWYTQPYYYGYPTYYGYPYYGNPAYSYPSYRYPYYSYYYGYQ
jgi:hypothetical protein